MLKKSIIPLFLLVFLVSCKKEAVVTPTPTSGSVSVLTQHNDNLRTGLNNQETILTTSNVNPKQFGKLFTLPVDDEVYSQPLVVGDLPAGSGAKTVVLIATVSNSVYEFDGNTGTLIWNKNFTEAGMRPPNIDDISYNWTEPYKDFTYNFGIVGTPVIDPVSRTIYFVARSTNGTNFYQYLHAVSIVTGIDVPGSPVIISASVPGTGDGNVNSIVYFDPFRNNQRQGLTLVKGVVYLTYASHADTSPYHGWILGYDSQTLQQIIVYNDTPGGEDGGIWESGMGMAADKDGNLYITTGNGTAGQGAHYPPVISETIVNDPNPDPTDLSNRAESAMKLTPSGSTLKVSSYFTPSNYADLNALDNDYGSMGTLLIPNSNYYFTGGKDGNIYLLNKDAMGGYSASSNQVQQTISINGSMLFQPAYYAGKSNEFVYVWSDEDNLRALPFNRTSNSFSSPQIISNLSSPARSIGIVMSASSNGITDGTGILWASYNTSPQPNHAAGPGILRAFDANDITKELWNSNQNPGDSPGKFAKFSAPTIANGHVYLATFSNQVIVYGLK
jgi:hypothetical protein